MSGSGEVSGTFEKKRRTGAEHVAGDRGTGTERKSKKLVERGAAF
jgi:hypothetical protein